MNDAVHRFRRQAGRELGDRQGAERRHSDGLRQQAVAYWRARESTTGLREVAVALGIAPVSLRRWAQDPRFRPVRVMADAPPVAAGLVVIIETIGVRVEGVDVETAAQLRLSNPFCIFVGAVRIHGDAPPGPSHRSRAISHRGRARGPGHGHASRRHHGVIHSPLGLGAPEVTTPGRVDGAER